MRRAVVVLIKNQYDEILLLQRNSTHEFPNQWCFPGGKCDYIQELVKLQNQVKIIKGTDDGVPTESYEESSVEITKTIERMEEYIEAAFRETLEETGIQLKSLVESPMWLADKVYVVKVFVIDPNARPEDDEYTIRKDFPNREHQRYGWFEDRFPVGCGPMTKELLTSFTEGSAAFDMEEDEYPEMDNDGKYIPA